MSYKTKGCRDPIKTTAMCTSFVLLDYKLRFTLISCRKKHRQGIKIAEFLL